MWGRRHSHGLWRSSRVGARTGTRTGTGVMMGIREKRGGGGSGRWREVGLKGGVGARRVGP